MTRRLGSLAACAALATGLTLGVGALGAPASAGNSGEAQGNSWGAQGNSWG